MTSQRGKYKTVSNNTKSSESVMFLLCCDVFCTFTAEQTPKILNLFILCNVWGVGKTKISKLNDVI